MVTDANKIEVKRNKQNDTVYEKKKKKKRKKEFDCFGNFFLILMKMVIDANKTEVKRNEQYLFPKLLRTQ